MALRNAFDAIATETTLAGLVSSRFYRLLNQNIVDGHEMRTALQESGDPNSNYFGEAPDGTATSAASWNVLRIYISSTTGKPTRWRTVTGAVWDTAITGSGTVWT